MRQVFRAMTKRNEFRPDDAPTIRLVERYARESGGLYLRVGKMYDGNQPCWRRFQMRVRIRCHIRMCKVEVRTA